MANFMCLGQEDWGGCTLVWIMIVFIFFGAALFRKWVANEILGTEFSLVGAAILGESVFIIMMLVLGSSKFAFLLGIVGMIAGGFLLRFLGGTETE